MFTAVLTKHTSSRGGPVLSQMRYVKERIHSNCERLIQYYQTSGGFVSSRHILIRLLSNLTVTMTTPTELYYELVLDNYDAAGRSLGVSTYMNRGAVHLNGSFFGQGSSELYLGIESPINPEHVHANWRAYRPVRVLRHDYGDLSCPLADGRGFPPGLAVFTIDVPMLALMYRAWNLEEAGKASGERETPANFIYQYVLPGLFASFTDIALFNRIRSAADSEMPLMVDKRHPMGLATPESYIGAISDRYLDWALDGSRTFDQLLEYFPQVFSNSLVSNIIPAHLLRTRQNKWVTTVSEIPVLSFLLTIDAVTESQANTGEKHEIARDIRIMDNERLLAASAGGVLAGVRDDIRTNIEPYLK